MTDKYVINYKALDRFQEDDPVVECCRCGEQIPLGDALDKDDQYYCEYCYDDMFVTISRYIVQTQNASINRIQSKFKCGFNRAQAIVEKLAELGVVSENMGSRARNVLMDDADLEDILSRL